MPGAAVSLAKQRKAVVPTLRIVWDSASFAHAAEPRQPMRRDANEAGRPSEESAATPAAHRTRAGQ
jgi:hypothetical protein